MKGPVNSRKLLALLDTGSELTVFRPEIAESIDISLGGPQGTFTWRGRTYFVEYHTVELELRQGATRWRWQARVGFSSAPLPYPLLGDQSCLQFIDAKFYGYRKLVELETNPSFPGQVTS